MSQFPIPCMAKDLKLYVSDPLLLPLCIHIAYINMKACKIMDWYIDTIFVYYKYHSNSCIYMNMNISVTIIIIAMH